MQQISNNEWIQWKGEEKSFQQISGDFETIEDSTAKTILSCFHETTSSKKKKKKEDSKLLCQISIIFRRVYLRVWYFTSVAT